MNKVIRLILGLTLVLMCSPAWGAIIYADPAVIHLGNPPNSGTYLFGTEVQQISNTYLGMVAQGNQPVFDNPMLLILGIPNDSSFPLPAITLSTGTGTAVGFATTLTAGEEVYGELGLGEATNNSNSFTNWAAADLAVNGITATSFGIYTYELNNSGLDGGLTLGVTFATALPNGTFAIGWASFSELIEHGANEGDTRFTTYTTPFTESGLTRVPEAGALLMFGSGLIGLVGYRRMRRMQ